MFGGKIKQDYQVAQQRLAETERDIARLREELSKLARTLHKLPVAAFLLLHRNFLIFWWHSPYPRWRG